VFSAVNGANSDDITKDTAKIIAPETSAHNDNIALNEDLFERVLAVYEQRDSLDLNPEQLHLLNEPRGRRAGTAARDQLRARKTRHAIQREPPQ
jgi:Zn-dependent oligopeptidase